MIGIKKFLSCELVHLTILLSLLRIDPNSYILDNHGIDDAVQEIVLGSSSAAFMFRNIRNGLRSRVHPKNIENTMLLNQRDIFYELNSLGRYDRYSNQPQEITTYLLCGQEAMSVVTEEEVVIVDGEDVPETEGESVGGGGGGSEGRPPVNHEMEDNNSTSSSSTSSSTSGTGDIQPSLNDGLSDMLTLILPQEYQATGSLIGTPYLANLGDISKEDMDLIEVLLRQDIDLGVTREGFDAQLRKELIGKEEEEPTPVLLKDEKDTEKEPDVLDPWSGLNYTIDCETGEHVVLDEAGPSSGSVSSSVFTDQSLNTSELLGLPDELDAIPLEELSLVSLSDKDDQEKLEDKDSGGEEIEDSSDLDLGLPTPLLSREDSFTEELKELEDMIQTAQLNNSGRGIQYLRSLSMEQRWQDLTTFLSFPPNSEAEMHHHNMSMGMLHSPGQITQHNYTVPNYGSIHNRMSSVLIQNATLPPPVADINSNMSYPGDIGGEHSNVGVAVITSMSTLANGSDSMGDTAPRDHFQMDNGTMMFPSNHSDVNQTADGFLSSILNEDDLHLMDMAMNEGMYTMRLLENDDAMDTSSDSAISSLGSSERVPSISDGQEWMETASESSHPEENNHFYGSDHPKYRQYSYSYAPDMVPTQRSNISSGNNVVDGNANGVNRRLPPVAQKKYQLFGKRVGIEPPMDGSTYGALPRGSPSMPQPTTPMKYPDYVYHEEESGSSYGSLEGATAPNNSAEQIEPKYSCSVEFARHNVVESPTSLGHIRHNHSYHLSSDGMSDSQRPAVRDKQRKPSVDDHLPRDEKRARALKIPLTTDEIINLPMDEFNERLSKHDLSEQQLALIRDIRRRGKNKVAAQNCRKRKLDQIIMLAEEVQGIHREREQLLEQQRSYVNERQRIKDKFSQLYRHVFQSLRDPDGNPYSPHDYSLQQAADGNILLVPRNGTVNMELDPSKGAKNKRKEERKK